ncbi:hypothetical protein RhiirA4_484103 [Rhizophagus irregularis]|uniref:Uncharacterized protein n=1 Tax=Rhizophagus irregularis TaxID=588596 RepID=A0A2I1HNG1_9GLOM|nr:hypothetical protein RhiirA4_484103 [Rhizophagus irregularis]
MRPKIVSGTPLEYKELMERYKSIVKKLIEIIRLSISKANTAPKINEISNFETNNSSSRLFTSKAYQFKNLPEPKNATESYQHCFKLPFCLN